MVFNSLPAQLLSAVSTKPLHGKFVGPGDSSISHRALILGATASGPTFISGLLENAETMATLNAMRALGVRIEKHNECWRVDGLGVGGLLEPREKLDFGSSALGVRLGLGLVGIYPFATCFRGNTTLSAQSMARVLAPLKSIGVEVLDEGQDHLPLTLKGPKAPLPLHYRLPMASASVKSALLLAGLSIPGTTTIIEPVTSVDHTENLLAMFGATIEAVVDAAGVRTLTMAGLPNLVGQTVQVPADPSAAAFPIVAALIVPGSELVIEKLVVNPNRTGLIDTLLEMGGNIEFFNQHQSGGEFIADLRVRHSSLKAMTVAADRVTTMYEDYPALAVAAACAQGQTQMLGLDKLPEGQVRRLADALSANGIECTHTATSLSVVGGAKKIGGGKFSGNDPRLAMALLVLGLGAPKKITVNDHTIINNYFPNFVANFEALGVTFGH